LNEARYPIKLHLLFSESEREGPIASAHNIDASTDDQRWIFNATSSLPFYVHLLCRRFLRDLFWEKLVEARENDRGLIFAGESGRDSQRWEIYEIGSKIDSGSFSRPIGAI